MQLAALIISIVALIVPSIFALRALELSRHSNSTRVLVDLFTEHRSEHLANARHFVNNDLRAFDPSAGLAVLPEEKRQLVRDLIFFYDNLGVLVHHRIVDLEPISGYLGGSVLNVWPKLKPFIDAEREKRRVGGLEDPRWQLYFQILHDRINKLPPSEIFREIS